MLSPTKPLGQCDADFTGMLPRWLLTKLAKIIPLQLTKWPPELEIEKSLNANSFYTPGPISFKPHRSVT